MEIGKQIRQIRELEGITQEELGKRAGMQQASVARFEAGKHIPKVETLRKLAKALNRNLVISFEK